MCLQGVYMLLNKGTIRLMNMQSLVQESSLKSPIVEHTSSASAVPTLRTSKDNLSSKLSTRSLGNRYTVLTVLQQTAQSRKLVR